jgi:hypothetical protein
MQRQHIMTTLALTLLAFACFARALAPLEPEDGIYLGAWLDTRPGEDSPVAFNGRIRNQASIHQLSQPFPLNFNEPPPWELVDDTNTNAMLFLTVYSRTSLLVETPTDTDIDELVKQVAGVVKNKPRTVFLRLNPEMNGPWMVFGQQPTAFLNLWRRVYTAFQANPLCRGKVAFVVSVSVLLY